MWDDEAFRSRIKGRSDELGRPLPKSLKSFLSKPASQGRRIDKIITIAAYLDWSLAQALGVAVASTEIVNEPRLQRAIEIADRIVTARQLTQGRTAALADEARRIYRILADRETQGRPVTDDEIDLIISSRTA